MSTALPKRVYGQAKVPFTPTHILSATDSLQQPTSTLEPQSSSLPPTPTDDGHPQDAQELSIVSPSSKRIRSPQLSQIDSPHPKKLKSRDPRTTEEDHIQRLPDLQTAFLQPCNAPSSPPPVSPTIIPNQDVDQEQVDELDEHPHIEPQPVLNKAKSKKMKLKSLTKKDKEETQRVIASCERQKNTRLNPTCRAPISTLQDIAQKASSTFTTNNTQSKGKTPSGRPSRLPRSHSIPHVFNPLVTQIIGAGKQREKVEQPPTSPIEGSSDNQHDELPTEDQIFPTDPPASTSKHSTTNEITADQTNAKKEWLAKLKNKTQQSSSTIQEQNAALNESDSDIDIVDKPTLTISSKPRQSSSFNYPLDPIKQRLEAGPANSKSNKKSTSSRLNANKSFSSTSKAKSNTNNDKFHNPQRSNLNANLLAKSAVDNAIIREKKLAEYVERGGRVSNRDLATINQNIPSEIDAVKVKTMLKEKQKNADANAHADEDENDVDYVWDEIGSAEEIETSDEEGTEEDKNEAADETDEDEVESCEESGQMTIRATKVSTSEAQSLITSETSALMPPPPLARCSMSSSSSGGSSRTLAQPPPPGQTSIGSTILAPNSNSTDRDSSRDSHPLVSDPSETEEMQPINRDSSSPVDLPGFNIVKPSQSPKKKHMITGSSSGKNRLSSPDDTPALTGFGNVECSGIDGFSDPETEGFVGMNAESLKKPVMKGVKNRHDEPGFSQLFDEDDGDNTFTHPPPLLKPKKIRILDDDDDDDDMNNIDSTCVLPAVNVLPEEKERDMMMMVLGAQDTTGDDDEQPSQYVNHRGLLTQNKPNGPPDSPLMSQDLTARTPFALRKQSTNREGQELLLGDVDFSPTKSQGASRVPSSWKVIRSPSPTLAPDPTITPINAFTKVMDAQKEQAATSKVQLPPPNKKTRASEGAGKVFLADEADESEDEYEGLAMRRRDGKGSGSDDEKGSDDEGSLVDLVDDGEDERDEKTRMEGNLAHRELAKKHEEEMEKKHSEQIQKIVAGKVRIKQARNHRSGDGGISDSDSEDDIEKERLKASKRAQEHAAKKKRRAIHLLADKHEPFFKSYEEGTNHAVDEDDLAYLQPQEEPKKGTANGDDSDDEDEDDDDGQGYGYGEEEEDVDEDLDNGELPEDVLFLEPKQKKSSMQKGNKSESADKVEEGEGDAKKARKGPGLSSSPILTSTVLPSRFKINNHHDRSLFTSKSSGTKTGKNDHADLDDMYDNLKSSKDTLDERQRLMLVNELGISAGPSGATEHKGRAGGVKGTTGTTGTSKTSSVTFHHFQQQQKPGKTTTKKSSNSTAAKSASSSSSSSRALPPAKPQKISSKTQGKLARLKQKNSAASS
ncbi:hypothetical protein PCASD_07513 [Puccinia coronata f. sp. avenae]|nr:hypothetical protein PCASD_07513 [Puccinia coronata f. sp. avenae]